MYSFFIVAILFVGNCHGGVVSNVLDDVTKATDLLLTFVIHRHGDRTPTPEFYGLSENVEQIIQLTYPFGAGGLTNEGKMRGYYIGQFLRERYNEMLSETFYGDEIYIRSTDVERTKMTILAALSAMYPPIEAQIWKDDLMWQPIPYTTVPAEDDFLMYAENCVSTNFMDLLGYYDPRMEKYEELLTLINEHISDAMGMNFHETPLMIFAYNDLILSEVAIGIPVADWLEPHMSELTEAAGVALSILYEKENVRRLTGGVYLNEFFTVANAIIAGEDVKQRVRIYSAHDVNVAAQLAASRAQFHYPKYGSVYALELRKDRATGEHIILPVFLQQVGTTSPMALPIDGCDDVCTFDQFRDLTADSVITLDQFKKECKEGII